MRYICAELAKAQFTGDFESSYGTPQIKAYIDEVPTADVEPVWHAHWVRGEDASGAFYLCSACGEELPRVCIKPTTIEQPYGVFENIDFTKRCPNCGAKMDEENKK